MLHAVVVVAANGAFDELDDREVADRVGAVVHLRELSLGELKPPAFRCVGRRRHVDERQRLADHLRMKTGTHVHDAPDAERRADFTPCGRGCQAQCRGVRRLCGDSVRPARARDSPQAGGPPTSRGARERGLRNAGLRIGRLCAYLGAHVPRAKPAYVPAAQPVLVPGRDAAGYFEFNELPCHGPQVVPARFDPSSPPRLRRTARSLRGMSRHGRRQRRKCARGAARP